MPKEKLLTTTARQAVPAVLVLLVPPGARVIREELEVLELRVRRELTALETLVPRELLELRVNLE